MRIIEGVLADFHAPLGSVRIPPGHIRLYHYTKGEPEVIRREGLRMAKAKGEGYGEPNAVWASTGMPDPLAKNVVEFHVDMDDPSMELDFSGGSRRDLLTRPHHLRFRRDILPSEIIQVHEPWHAYYEMISKQPDKVAGILAGEYDWILDRAKEDPVEARAVAEVKRRHGR